MKTCFKCGEAKPLTDFYPHPRMADGHLNKCKSCAKRDSLERHHLKSNDPSWVEGERARGREKHRRLYSSGRQWVAPQGTPEQKKWATTQVNNALRDGRLVKSKNCNDCGKPYHRMEGHHLDYNKPLEVLWLCKPCHAQRHLSPPSKTLSAS